MTQTLPIRQFTPYEQTQLSRHGISLDQAQARGEMPVEYITGHVSFNQLDLLVTPDVLIPRVETEALAQRAAELAQNQIAQLASSTTNQTQTWRALDLGTGCGAIAIYLAQALVKLGSKSLKIEIFASDISSAALTVAANNAKRLVQVSPWLQLKFVSSDLWQNLPAEIKFDLVIANLPYIPSERIPILDESVKNYEPWLALDGGPDGLNLIRPMLDQAPLHLRRGGQVLLEVDYTQTRETFQPWFDRFSITAQVDEFLKQRYITGHLR